ncbi:SusC/RagA family TonB-linked outer membrane protein [Sphingobacterium thalpophilum]|uniref:Outer membrane cobalamin receptor protein n=1 Tax=Sphingobacterium thalpophilum TaxID=259 RepID=A0A4U9U408_9SPHI|nr:TonB-dependent receptor [Sphingobacterium thalpophilum]VTR27600.1 Outer membrane cobalamin receptor protein [Sphingobacterium thalpophilum]
MRMMKFTIPVQRQRWLQYGILPLLFLLAALQLAFAQDKLVKGLVSDQQKQPIEGVTVSVKGGTRSTTTDSKGTFTIEAGNGAVLVFTNVGYKTAEVPVGANNSVQVTLQSDDIAMEEVVVIGYGTQRKEAVTGSVASVSGTTMNEVPAANISRALQGRIAGVNMQQNSSKPGSPMQIRIRGTRSLTADNNPLIVLDGIPFAGSISDINPADIKSVDVLKDASATAIYGSRGANGVILVTTNKGRMGQQAQLAYNGFTGLRTVFAKYPMMSGPEFAEIRRYVGQFQNTLDESDDTNTDWQDLFYKNGMVNSHDISVNGGAEKGNYNFGAGYFRDEGVVPLQNYTRYNLRAALDQQVGKIFKFGFNLNQSYSITNGNNLGLYGVLSASPIANPFNADGTLKSRIQQQTSGQQWVHTRESYEALGDSYINQQRVFGSYNNMYSEIRIPGVEGLIYRTNLGLNFRQNNDGSYTGQGVFSGTPDNVSTASVANGRTVQWVMENLLTYDRTFAQKHNLNLVALYSAEQNTTNSTLISARDIPIDAFQFYNIGRAQGEIIVNPDQQGYAKSSLMSFMGRAMYTFDNRYMLTMTMRRDGSSRLAPGHKWHAYPAISAGWNIHNEKFRSAVPWINQLKLRLGYGQTSNQAVDPYKTLGLLSTRPYNFDTQFLTGYYMSELPNPSLGWEFSKTYNYGLDFGLFNNRVSGTMEYYVQNTDNILLRVGLPPTNGGGSYMANIGKTQNKGFELSLNGAVIDNENGWKWDVGVNLYANRNKLVELTSGSQRDEGNQWFVGHPIDVIYDYKKIGLWQADDPYRDILEPGGNVGMIKVEYTGEYDANGVPTRAIGAADRQIINIQPNFLGGFNTRLAYKNVDLNVVGTFQNGGTLISSLYGSTGYLNQLNTRAGNNVSVEYWREDRTDAKYPKPGGIQSGDNPKYGSTLGYFDASYLKVRTITMGYNFKQKWVERMGIGRLRLYATVENPFVLFSPYHKESGGDPEPNSYGDENVAVGGLRRILVVGTNTPAMRSYILGLNLSF